MTLPGFLIIGAMKAGTTTLFRDLLLNPRVYFPVDKEPEHLCHDRVLTEPGLAEYERLFAKASPGQLCAEASTAYTKHPVFTGAAQRAEQVLGTDFRVLYLVRDPIARLISQHRHEIAVGKLHPNPDINAAIRETPRFLDYSRYAMQLRPWVEALGPERVGVIIFERYTGARAETIEAVSRFLGLEPMTEIDQDRAYNRAEDKRAARGVWRWVIDSPVYKKTIRPLLSADAREKLRRLLPKAERTQGSLSAESRAWAVEQLGPDAVEFVSMLRELNLVLPPGPEPFRGWESVPVRQTHPGGGEQPTPEGR